MVALAVMVPTSSCPVDAIASNGCDRTNQKEIKQRFSHAATPELEFLELELDDLNEGQPLHLLVNNSSIANVPFAMSAEVYRCTTDELEMIQMRALIQGIENLLRDER
ncbi:hypothetical protein BGZ83_003227, partial [Gryganskiella cystojenkinii]